MGGVGIGSRGPGVCGTCNGTGTQVKYVAETLQPSYSGGPTTPTKFDPPSWFCRLGSIVAVASFIFVAFRDHLVTIDPSDLSVSALVSLCATLLIGSFVAWIAGLIIAGVAWTVFLWTLGVLAIALGLGLIGCIVWVGLKITHSLH